MKIAAFKHPDWTGRVVVLVNQDESVTFVRLDGVYYGGQVTGRVIGSPRVRWYFSGPASRQGVPSLPPWVHLLPESVVCTSVAPGDVVSATSARIPVRSRGIGAATTPVPCFVCGEVSNDVRPNLAMFVDSLDDGVAVVVMIGPGAWLDYRDHYPDWTQVKVVSCLKHEGNLRILTDLIEPPMRAELTLSKALSASLAPVTP